jgi:uncharacterized membrane protein
MNGRMYQKMQNRTMKALRKISLYLLVIFYVFMGLMHLISPEQYYPMMPSWLPQHSLLIVLSGVVEIALALLLLFPRTRVLSAWALIVMLVFYFFIIHLPQSIDFYYTSNPSFGASLVRLPIQFLLIAWLWVYTRNIKK